MTSPQPLTPDLVNAIVRDMDDPRYPSQITVFCDHCGVEFTGEFMVSSEMTRDERLGVARQHLVQNEGWEHTDDGDDFCPTHAATATIAASPLTAQQLDDIARSVAAHFNHDETPEARAARWESAAHAAGREVDRNALTAYLAVADAEQRALADSWARVMAATDEKIRRLTARQLTEGEYNAAWHAVEGAAGEEGADPGTILHAVLNRLGITWPGTAVPKAKELSAADLLALAAVLEIPRPGNVLPIQLRRSYGHTDRWAICDHEGRRWHREHGWVVEAVGIRDEAQRDATRFTLAEAVPLACQLADPNAAAEETHVVADDSSNPEHIDDCPGCHSTTAASEAQQ